MSQPPTHRPQYSFVIPLFNEEETLNELYTQLSKLFNSLEGETELILVDDGSRDRSLEMLRSLHQKDPRVRYLSLSRNFGHQIALSAGLQFATGKAVIVMDADLQDPPDVVPEMIQKWHEGCQVVYGQRLSRRNEGFIKRWTAFIFYRILRQLSDVNIPPDTGDFCLMDQAVVQVLKQMPERNRYIRGLRAWVGFRQTAVRFDRPGRYAGDVKYTFRKSFRLAINSILGFSIVPLRLATYLGLFSAALAGLMMALILYWRFFDATTHRLEGFAVIAIAVFFLGAVQLICIGILGEYIGRIYEEVKGRPLYTLKEVEGFEPQQKS
jgi:polyisoprenyl-phosphate glycosyltransferase